VLARVPLEPTFLRGDGVLRVDTWQRHLLELLPEGSEAAWGPAAFALQMVHAPLQMIFANEVTGA
jgi:hypothetical protein